MLTSTYRRARGVTLLELLVVLMILSIVLTAAVKTWDVTLERGRAETTARKLDQLVTVIVGDPNYIVAGHRADFGYVGDEGLVPAHLSDLMIPPFSPDSVWRGPYLRSTFSQSANGYRIDGWGDTIIYGRDAYSSNDSLFVRSYGGRGVADRSRWQTVNFPYSYQALLQNTVQGRLVDIRGDPVPAEAPAPSRADSINQRLLVVLYGPKDGRLVAVDSAKTTQAASFLFLNIPQGTHRLVAKFTNSHDPSVTDSTVQDVPVYPNSGARDIILRLPRDWDDPLDQ
jgi:prepilin-type N-terminal cleavage/methylation domain-containing protein